MNVHNLNLQNDNGDSIHGILLLKLMRDERINPLTTNMYQTTQLAVVNKQIFTGVGVPDQSLGNDGDQYIDTSTNILYNKDLGVWVSQGSLQGPPGESGSQILVGNGIPPPNIGVDGDYYINNNGAQLYRKIGGVWVPQGTFSGSTIFVNAGVPSSSLGSDGDYYIDNITNNYYLKENGVWTPQGSLEGIPGVQGSPGNDILTGNGPPFFVQGRDGDYYIDVDTGNYYKYVLISWTARGTLTGPQGIPGQNGSEIFTGNGIPTISGQEGDYYVDNLTGSYYQYSNGNWILRGNLRGPVGEQGTPGSQIIVGSGPPLNSFGNTGDYYIDNLSNQYYQYNGTTWSPLGSLQGPDGSKILVASGPPDAQLGKDGDYYINNQNGDYYLKTSSLGWGVPIGNLTGPQGNVGERTLMTYTGNGMPSQSLGNDGDQYIDYNTNILYVKSSGIWVPGSDLTGIPGSAGSTTIDPALFGDGSDGNLSLGNQITLSRDMYYNNLTLVPGGVIFANGYRIFVRGLMSFQGGAINAVGRNANGAIGGSGVQAGTLGGSGSGATPNVLTAGNSDFAAFVSGTTFRGGNGGGSGDVYTNAGTVSTEGTSAVSTIRNLLDVTEMRTPNGNRFTGGSGGGAGTSPSTGGGGGGGGVVLLVAGTVSVTLVGSFDIFANGGNGSNSATGGGGGGGGGGLVVVVSGRRLQSAIRVNVAGGSPGTGPSGNGSGGSSGFFQHIFV
ncbi:Collagen-like protein [Orpheovirus IHUMI-LCC2]|uniref:Collagen-like protein n=1 Tax=Orpheovirus IHUMI-LCC2 TaxID=2023057 RepID=A0A2I2L3I6_9VIRU|nr:Collagen-like protein [Orpheovirus IHUMI-LCC2]SNW62029.1 Collagen-like protein [Orpheovirus IHUMI-LCC2]